MTRHGSNSTLSARRVDTSSLESLIVALGDGTNPEAVRSAARRLPAEMARLRRQLGVQPVAINGSRSRGLKMGWFQQRLKDGTTGYYQRSGSDCLRVAIATALQVQPHRVPDLQVEQMIAAGKDVEEIELAVWGKLLPWLDQRGVTMMLHPTLPTATKRWVGVTWSPEPFSSHCLLMNGRDVTFDPFRLFPPRKGEPASVHTVNDIDFGLSLE